MGPEERFTEQLARWLRERGLSGFAALLLEGAKPLAIIGAQASYLADPLFGAFGLPLADVGRLLEDPDQIQDLLERLQESEITE